MDIYGIENITENDISYNYDKKHREIAIKLKNAKSQDEICEIKKVARREYNNMLKNVRINMNTLKDNFLNLLEDENSSKYLWILYSKYDGEENYIDKISNILKEQNKISRGGTNTYKINGWMMHTLYVYQIVNDNIVNNKEIINFNGSEEKKEEVAKLHKIYKTLSKEAKFLLKIFTLIHDIGVMDKVEYHDKLGSKYVRKVLEELNLNQAKLDEINVLINIEDFIKILETLIKYHTLITALSSECSDAYVEDSFRDLLKNIPESSGIKVYIPKILWIMSFADVTAVDESLMDKEKYNRIKECYLFFECITKGKPSKRNKRDVAIERICDMCGESKVQNLSNIFEDILEKNKIDKNKFIEDMYDIKYMRYTGPLMKNLKDIELSIRIFYGLVSLIRYTEGGEELKNYMITFIPDKHEKYFVEQFKNGNFFKCIEKMKINKLSECTYENVNISKGVFEEGKYLHIRII